MRISATSRSRSVCDTLDTHSFRLDDPGHGDAFVPGPGVRPRLAGRPGNFGFDEQFLDFLLSSVKPFPGTPASYLKPWHVGRDPPFAPAPFAVESDRFAL